MRDLKIKLVICINYFVFALLLNSVGIVIKQSIDLYGVSEVDASILEAFKDLPIAIVSFFTASFLTKIGYKRSIVLALILVFFGCIYMYITNNFFGTKVLFCLIGISFALIKVTVYTLIGHLATTKQHHNSLMSFVEGVFMVGIATTYFLFPVFFDNDAPQKWVNVYLCIAILVLITLIILSFTKIEFQDQQLENIHFNEILKMMNLLKIPLVIVFICSAFLFVMIEQGIMTWLPTFNKKVLVLNDVLSVQMASLLAISIALGRLFSSYLLKKISWIIILVFCLVIAAIIVGFVLPEALATSVNVKINSFLDIPTIGYIFPLIGLFIAPVYPIINSVILSALPLRLHSKMTGLIVVFSALGGTLGSRIIGYLFQNVGGDKAFTYITVPIVVLIVLLIIFNEKSKKNEIFS